MSDMSNENEENEICYLDELIIEGTTTEGKKFRPSDWVDRICGMLAGFKQQKVTYSDYLRPLVYKSVNCVAVRKQMEQDLPDTFTFIMQFANDNKLIVVDCAKFKHKIEQETA